MACATRSTRASPEPAIRFMLIGIDIGQSALKVTALLADGRVLGFAAEELATAHPAPGWVEQRPDDWIAAAGRACQALLALLRREGTAEPVAAVGLSAATHHAVLLDEADRPLRPCILLSDGRAAAQARRLQDAHGPLILERARNVASSCWCLPQLVWVREQEPATWARVRRVLFAKDYLRLALTGEWATDRIDAEGSLLFDPTRGEWDADLCALAALPVSSLPPALSPTAISGRIDRRGADLTGLPAGTPVIAGCSDTAAEAFAAGACAPGQAVVKLATAGNVNLITDRPQPRPEWFTYSHPLPGLSYHALGTNSAATSLRWLRDVLRGEGEPITYAKLDAAATVPPGAGGVLFRPYLLGERAPHWDPDLRASFLGLRMEHGHGHLARAVLEGVALSLADCLGFIRSTSQVVDTARIIGGGARSPLWRQIVADVLGIVLAYPAHSDASSGAAMLAGIGAGTYASHHEAMLRAVRVDAEVQPDPALHAFYAELLAIFRDAQQRLAPIDHALTSLRPPASR